MFSMSEGSAESVRTLPSPEKQRMQFNVYFLGIGGIGMSALARYFLHEGRRVAGYDRVRSHLTDQIEAEGAVVHYEEDPALIPADFRDPATTIVVYTPAVPADHAELRWFRQNGFEIVKRSQMLGYLSQGKFVIAVAGTHGKTTTTTLVAWLNHRVTGGGSAFLGGISRNFSSNLVLRPGRRRRSRPTSSTVVPAAVADVAVVSSADAIIWIFTVRTRHCARLFRSSSDRSARAGRWSSSRVSI